VRLDKRESAALNSAKPMESPPSPPPVAPSKPRATLRAFEVHNYRLFKHERIEIHPEVTVLVGENDVGKTTLLDAMSLYGRIAQGTRLRPALESDEFEGTGEQATRFVAEWEDESGQIWAHSLTLDAAAPRERLERGEQSWQWNPKTRVLEAEQRSFRVKRLPEYTALSRIEVKRWQLDANVPSGVYEPLQVLRTFRTPRAYLFEPSALGKLSPARRKIPLKNGYGWAVWLQEIINQRNGEIEILERDVQTLFKFFGRVRVHEVSPRLKYTQLELFSPEHTRRLLSKATELEREILIDVATTGAQTDGPMVQVPAARASSGLLLALAHFTLLHTVNQGDLLFLEEPENGLNGKITLEMMQTFLAAIRRRKRQLVLTTHHPWWLDLVPHDSIRVLTRDADGGHIKTVPKELVEAGLEKNDVYPSEIMGTFGPEGLLYLHRRDR
jgi:energy-coupling factor transporter ATP-binding protein EcfA2